MINSQTRNVLREIVGDGKILYNCPLKNYTSYRIGGPADALITVDRREQLSLLFNILKNDDIPFFVIGRGTNLLIDDSGYRGFVLKLEGEFKEMSVEGNMISAGAALMMPRLVMACAKKNLGGIEHLAVIPGTVGGGIVQNAGSSNKEIKSSLASVEIMDIKEGIKTIKRDELRMSYRTSIFKHEAKKNVILASKLLLEPRDFVTIKNDIKENMEKRKHNLPLKEHSAGSIFKRAVNGISPGKLIEEAGCKGLSIGDAEVSQKHANFIVNRGHASFSDVLNLIEKVRETVLERTGAALELEVEIIK